MTFYFRVAMNYGTLNDFYLRKLIHGRGDQILLHNHKLAS